MDSESVGSTVPRRQLGRYLRSLREGAKPKKITIEVAAGHLECSTQKIWRIEKGESPVRGIDVKALCELYGATPEMTEALIGLARETKAKGWWQSYGDAVPEWFDLYIGLEAASNRIRKYEPVLVPGLLQAPAYMEAVITAGRPELNESEVDRRIKLKQERQGLLSRHFPSPPRLEVIVSEAVLRTPPAMAGAMHQQLWHLLKANEQDHLSVRVLPLSVGPHRASVSGAFTILEFPTDEADRGEPPTIYSESLTGALYLDRPRELETYERVWSALADRAFNEADSDDMIKAIMTQGEMN